jgi:hypothetical protein
MEISAWKGLIGNDSQRFEYACVQQEHFGSERLNGTSPEHAIPVHLRRTNEIILGLLVEGRSGGHPGHDVHVAQLNLHGVGLP